MGVEIITPPTAEHVAALAADMREEDVDECLAAGFTSPLDAVTKGVAASSVCWTCLVDGRLMGIFGLTSGNVSAGEMVLWLLTTHLANRKPITFVRIARQHLMILASMWGTLELGIDKRHIRALRLASRSGFKVGRSYPHPTTGKTFVMAKLEA